jgi:hypothetical protein
MKTILSLLGVWALAFSLAQAQTAADTISENTFGQRRVVGLNMSPLIAHLVPFNRVDPREAGPFLVRFKKYGPLRRSAFRFSMGFHMIPNADFDTFEDAQFNFALGWEKRRSISRRWSYTRGFDFMFLAGDLNVPGAESDEFEAAVAIGPLWGIEFAVAERITLGTEAVLAIGFATEQLLFFTIIPPVGIFLQHYF